MDQDWAVRLFGTLGVMYRCGLMVDTASKWPSCSSTIRSLANKLKPTQWKLELSKSPIDNKSLRTNEDADSLSSKDAACK